MNIISYIVNINKDKYGNWGRSKYVSLTKKYYPILDKCINLELVESEGEYKKWKVLYTEKEEEKSICDLYHIQLDINGFDITSEEIKKETKSQITLIKSLGNRYLSTLSKKS